jgi:hypothetical protein
MFYILSTAAAAMYAAQWPPTNSNVQHEFSWISILRRIHVPTSVNKMFPLYLKVLFCFKNHQTFLAHHTYNRSCHKFCYIFIFARGETGVRVYQEDVLQGVVKHRNIFSGQEWFFQQESVPAQKTKTNQEWLWRKLPAFISAENWLLGSADLKTLENKLWAVLEDMACQKDHNSLDSLRRSLVKTAAEIPLETERVVTAVAGGSQGLR